MKKSISTLLIVVAIICFAIALSYPVKYLFQKNSNERDMNNLRQMRRSALENSADQKSQEELNDELPGEQPTLAPTAEGIIDSIHPLQTQESEAFDSTAEGKTKTMGQEGTVQGPVDSEIAIVEAQESFTTPQQTPAFTEPIPEQQGITCESTEYDGLDRKNTSAQPDEALVCQDSAQDARAGDSSSASEEQEEFLDQEDPNLATLMPAETVTPSPTTFDRYYRESNALPYPDKEKVQFDENAILPQYREIYDENHDFVGWISIPDTPIDYPVMQSEDSDYYLKRDFYGNENANGQLILDSSCDPWTPSYNLVISGHNMNSGKMFASIANYNSKYYWQSHKIITYDSLMREGKYVVVAAFYSADYDVDEEGFRYNADIQYRLDLEMWMEEIEANRLYDTGIDVEFGDEFLTLTTCVYQRENGRFVVVARRIREGEVIES